jgi:hypothetical protein
MISDVISEVVWNDPELVSKMTSVILEIIIDIITDVSWNVNRMKQRDKNWTKQRCNKEI